MCPASSPARGCPQAGAEAPLRAAARAARASGERVSRLARRTRLLSRFERLALLRVDLRDGRVAETSRAAVACACCRVL